MHGSCSSSTSRRRQLLRQLGQRLRKRWRVAAAAAAALLLVAVLTLRPLHGNRASQAAVATYLEATTEAAASAAGAEAGGSLDVRSAVCLHGRVPKRGPLPYLRLLAERHSQGTQHPSLVYLSGIAEAHTEERGLPRLEFDKGWIGARRWGKPRRHPTVPYCQVLYSDRLRLIFHKIPKTASTTLLQYFTVCPTKNSMMNGAAGASGDGLGTALPPHDPERCLRYLDTHNASEVQHVLQAYASYFVFAFVRNVLARAVSSYVYIAGDMRAGRVAHPRPAPCFVPWQRFCVDPFRWVREEGRAGAFVCCI